MYYYIKNELIKIVYVKKIYLGLIAGLMFSIVFSIFFYQNADDMTFFGLMKDMLIHICTLNFYVFVLGFSTFIYSLEFEERTIKVIRSKPISLLKFLTAKYAAGIVYTLLFYLSFALITALLALLFFKSGDFYDYKDEALIAMSKGWKYTASAYLLQAFASIFIIALLYLFTIIFENGVIAFIATFFIVLGGSIFGRRYFIHKLLPMRYLEMWRLIYQETIPWGQVALYSAIISGFIISVFVLSYLILRNKEVKA